MSYLHFSSISLHSIHILHIYTSLAVALSRVRAFSVSERKSTCIEMEEKDTGEVDEATTSLNMLGMHECLLQAVSRSKSRTQSSQRPAYTQPMPAIRRRTKEKENETVEIPTRQEHTVHIARQCDTHRILVVEARALASLACLRRAIYHTVSPRATCI